MPGSTEQSTSVPRRCGPHASRLEPTLRCSRLRSRQLRGADGSARGLPRGLDPAGSLRGTLAVPERGALGASLRFDGTINRIPASIQARISDETIAVVAHVPKAEPAELLRELVPELSIQVPVQLLAFAAGNTRAASI